MSTERFPFIVVVDIEFVRCLGRKSPEKQKF